MFPSRRRAVRPLTLALLAAALLAGPAPAPAPAQAGSPAGPVPLDRLSARRTALLERLGDGVAVIRSADQRELDPPNADYAQDSDFRQDNDFFYLTGLETPGSWLVLEARRIGTDQVFLYLPPRNPVAERWTGPELGPGPDAAALTGIPEEAVRSTERMDEEIARLVTGPESPVRLAEGAFYFKRDRRHQQLEVIRRLAFRPEVVTRDLLPSLAALRLIKDPDEIVRLRRAVAITIEGHLAAFRAARPGVMEYELEAAAEAAFRSGGAERLGYASIVGAGLNSTILHYDKGRGRAEAGDLIVMDMGAEFGYYSADITRTIPASGRFTPRQRALYDLVLGAQQAALDSVRPGQTIARLNQIARQYLRQHSAALCGDEGCERYFIHGLSHWIGLDVHDVGSYSTPLAPGMVLTIEPGLYLPEERIGIRIEDDVLVTPAGYELLSAALPRAAAAVEAAMRSRR